MGTAGCAQQILSLDHSWLGDGAATQLGTALRHNTSLRALSLCHNGIGDYGATALLAGHTANELSVLQGLYLYLAFNVVSPTVERALQATFESRMPPGAKGKDCTEGKEEAAIEVEGEKRGRPGRINKDDSDNSKCQM